MTYMKWVTSLLVGWFFFSSAIALDAQDLPQLEYDSARGVYILTYLDDDSNPRTVDIVPPNRVDPSVQVSIENEAVRDFRYTISNGMSEKSTQRIWMFEASCPAPDHASISSTPVDWTGEILRDRTGEGFVCEFMAPHDGAGVNPGEMTGGFVVTSSQLPKLVFGRAWGMRPEAPVLEGKREIELEEAELMSQALGSDGGWKEFPVVAPAADPPPADPVNHLKGIQADLQELCELGWIDDSGVCNSLERKLVGAIEALERNDPAAARDKLESFLSELDAQRGKHVNENAYWLLYLHGEDILNRI